ncbi:peptidoglycan-binding domain-containing protein [Cohaesibacter haloalkalitolerans]|uniref:peptidoglycan-binding domain-containing protein n=1 Tax=Cohaesibacter haloalkalitolerans TaxID=1162980 RepID=UPI000E6477B4|nr:peptidoglycan-binding protein [Cohaesibacter haloalkalitolerans]
MNKKLIAALMLGFSYVSVASPAMAGGGDAVAGAIIGGTLGLMLGGAAAHSHPVRRPPPPPRYYQTPEETRYNMDIQTRLNYLGYNAGGADGVMGRRSRAAISDFQYEAGFPVTGRLTNEQVSVLFSPEFEQAHFNPVSPNAPLSNPPAANNTVAPVDQGSDNAASAPADTMADAPEVVSNDPAPSSTSTPIKPLTGANTTLSFSKGAPAFFGITLGQSYDHARTILTENGYANCTGTGEIVTCTSDQEGVSKRFKLARSMDLDGQPIYMMDSDTKLMVDVEKSVIEGKLAESYPELTAAPNRVISDNANCALKMAKMPDVENFLDRLEIARDNPDQEPSDWLRGMIDTCDIFYKANVAEISGGYDVRVVMFKGTYVQQDFANLEEKKLNKVKNALTF